MAEKTVIDLVATNPSSSKIENASHELNELIETNTVHLG
jgi:hypothetical protein